MPRTSNPKQALYALIGQLGMPVVEYLLAERKTQDRAKAIAVGRAKAKGKKAAKAAATPVAKVRKARAATATAQEPVNV